MRFEIFGLRMSLMPRNEACCAIKMAFQEYARVFYLNFNEKAEKSQTFFLPVCICILKSL